MNIQPITATLDLGLHTDTVVERLTRVAGCTLPEMGILAGGAVANTILSIIDNKSYPINDLDVFNRESITCKLPSTIVHGAGDLEFNAGRISAYHNLLHPALSRSLYYRVTQSTEQGKMNYIAIQVFSDSDSNDLASDLVASFDLNCCQAGLDLKTGKLVWSPAFAEFVQTRQLRVEHAATPGHTAIRLAKKMAELQCQCDLEAELTMLATLVAVLSKPINSVNFLCGGSKLIATQFADKYGQLFMQYKPVLETYASLELLQSYPTHTLYQLQFADRLVNQKVVNLVRNSSSGMLAQGVQQIVRVLLDGDLIQNRMMWAYQYGTTAVILELSRRTNTLSIDEIIALAKIIDSEPPLIHALSNCVNAEQVKIVVDLIQNTAAFQAGSPSRLRRLLTDYAESLSALTQILPAADITTLSTQLVHTYSANSDCTASPALQTAI